MGVVNHNEHDGVAAEKYVELSREMKDVTLLVEHDIVPSNSKDKEVVLRRRAGTSKRKMRKAINLMDVVRLMLQHGCGFTADLPKYDILKGNAWSSALIYSMARTLRTIITNQCTRPIPNLQCRNERGKSMETADKHGADPMLHMVEDQDHDVNVDEDNEQESSSGAEEHEGGQIEEKDEIEKEDKNGVDEGEGVDDAGDNGNYNNDCSEVGFDDDAESGDDVHDGADEASGNRGVHEDHSDGESNPQKHGGDNCADMEEKGDEAHGKEEGGEEKTKMMRGKRLNKWKVQEGNMIQKSLMA